MQTHISTTPFGRRPMTLGMIASQVTAKSAPEGAKVDKWKVFYAIRDAKELLGATDRALTVLNALLSFHLEAQLSADGELIVWPSNE
ncbi:MAG: helix-turn-helix domain-containing protein, partial [Hyphomicrobiales bacterium]